MQEEDSWILMRHVAVNGHDVDTRRAKGFEHWLQLVFEHGEVSIHNRVVVSAGEGGPGVHAHFFTRLFASVHLHRSTESSFEHAVFGFAFVAEHFLKRSGRNGTLASNSRSS